MLRQKYIPIQEYENSTKKFEYQTVYKKYDELKSDNIENEGIVKNGNDFMNCKIIHDRDSTTDVLVPKVLNTS